MLADQRRDKILIFALVFPGQDRVARQDPMAQGVEARQLVAGSFDRELVAVTHDQELPRRLSFSASPRRRAAFIASASSASISASHARSTNRSYVRRHMPLGRSGRSEAAPGSPPSRTRILLARLSA